MISSFHSRKSIFWALCIVLLVVRFGGAHWHLCYDGNEQPRAVHVGDIESAETGAGHTDADLNLVESGLAKYFKSMHELPALLCAIALLFLLLPRSGGAPALPPIPLFRSSLRYHPATPRAPPR
jgi:hypothetical protein